MWCRQYTRAAALRTAASAVSRPLGRAPKLSVCFPPWNAVGQHHSILQQAYGGFWNVPTCSHKHANASCKNFAVAAGNFGTKSVDNGKLLSTDSGACEKAGNDSAEQMLQQQQAGDRCAFGEEGTAGGSLEQCMCAVRNACAGTPSAAAVLALGSKLYAAQNGYLSTWGGTGHAQWDMLSCRAGVSLEAVEAALLKITSCFVPD